MICESMKVSKITATLPMEPNLRKSVTVSIGSRRLDKKNGSMVYAEKMDLNQQSDRFGDRKGGVHIWKSSLSPFPPDMDDETVIQKGVELLMHSLGPFGRFFFCR